MTPMLRGVLWMLVAMSFIAIVDGMAKYVGQSIHGIQIAWAYFIAILVNLFAYALFARRSFRSLFAVTQVKLQFVRGLCIVMSLCLLFTALQFLPLAEATAISFTSPLFIVALATPLLGERVSWDRWFAVLIGLAGALLIVRPGTELFTWAAFLPLIGAVFFALFSIATRLIGNSDPVLSTLVYTFTVSAALTSLVLPWVWITPTLADAAVCFLMGTLGTMAHLSMIRSMVLADASVVAPLNYVRLVWAIGIGLIVFGQRPDGIAMLGGAIVAASGLYVVLRASNSAER